MAEILVLSSETIDKIAAGEVVEKPMSVVKELVENAMDAGATMITVEIKNGGIDLIRVSDNGTGMEIGQIPKAFYRHATSKIRDVKDLSSIESMGFRGEALSSIAAVSKVELITKTRDALVGARYEIEGGVEKSLEEAGAPVGTTFLVKQLFYNVPVRRNFLKKPPTEAGYIGELLERLAMSRPDISFKFIQNNDVKFHTQGNGDLKEVIYRIYGREIAKMLLPIDTTKEGIRVHGYLGKPEINRSNRNFEHYFINGRYVKSSVISKAIEDGYKQYVMQHKFPFVVLQVILEPEIVDVNVHPTKMEVRFSDEMSVYRSVVQSILEAFRSKELIVEATLSANRKETPIKPEIAPEAKKNTEFLMPPKPMLPPVQPQEPKKVVPVMDFTVDFTKEETVVKIEEKPKQAVELPEVVAEKPLEQIYEVKEAVQATLFEPQFLSREAKSSYEILGQIFKTYWLVAYEDKLYMIDQHAAHEKVKYERLVSAIRQKTVLTQALMPPYILQVSTAEERVIVEQMEAFTQIGFEIEEFGPNTFCVRSVPVDLFGHSYESLFKEMLDELTKGVIHGEFEVICEKLASMACKSAVKGNHELSRAEVEELIDELLTLENPYHCPHGRPTIISMTKQEIEKKFKRIV
ncbi:MAG: DNA mismatch repair endonuclease MutL [Lachnospiraceae bacterium]